MSVSEEDPKQRRSRYVRMALEAKKLAEADKRVGLRESCLHVAGSWLKLAGNEDGQAALSASETSSASETAATDPVLQPAE